MDLQTISEPEEIIRRIVRCASDSDDIVIDGPAGLSEMMRAIMLRADKVFLLCEPSNFSTKHSGKTARIGKEMINRRWA